MKEGLRFSYLELENFKNIEKKIVEIDGRSLLITGKNGQGKSSLIQALLSGLDAKAQASEPIKNGETKAMTKVKIAGVLNGKEEEYTVEMFYTPKNKKGRIVLTDAQGNSVPSPKEMLKSIIGNISFDIFKFLNDKKPNQIKILKELSGVGVEIDKLDMKRKELFDERTFLNRKVNEDEAVMNNHGLSQDQIDTYFEPVDIAPINEEMAAIGEKISKWQGVKIKTEAFQRSANVVLPAECIRIEEAIDEARAKIKQLEEDIVSMQKAMAEATRQMVDANESYEKGKAWLEKNPEPKATEISERLSAALLHNENHEKVKGLAEKQKALLEGKQKLAILTEDIEKIDSKKDALIKKSKLPIKGLTFTEDNIFLDNIPFEEGQINTAKLIETGMEISMALNPNLRVIFLHEGSLIDKDALNVLIKKVEEKGYQLIAEIVSSDPDLQITFTESDVE